MIVIDEMRQRTLRTREGQAFLDRHDIVSQPCTTTVGQRATSGVGGRPGRSNAGAIKKSPEACKGRDAAAARNPPRLEPASTGCADKSRPQVNNLARRPSTVSMPR